MLEPLFAGNIYQTHLGIGNKRFSMAKLNDILIWVALACWIFIFEMSILVISLNFGIFLITMIIALSFISFSDLLIGHAILSEDKGKHEYELTQYKIELIASETSFPRIVKNIKNIIKQWAYGIVFMIVMLVAAYCFIHFTTDINMQFSDLSSIFKINVKIAFPFLF